MAALDHFVVYAFLLAFMINTDISKHAQTKLCYLLPSIIKHLAHRLVVQYACKTAHRIFTKESFNPVIAEGQIDESFQQVYEVLRLIVVDVLGIRVGDEAIYHLLWHIVLHQSCTTVIVDTHTHYGESSCLPDSNVLIFKQVFQMYKS